MRSNIVLGIVSLLVAIGLCEIILRMFVPQETKRLAMFDEQLGWRGVPNGEGTYIRSRDNISVRFRYNAAGFRDEDFPRDDSHAQIVILGDSFVESLEVPYEVSFHEQLESDLNGSDASPVAVVNISSQGYSTAQELLAYRKFRNALHPEIVLLAFYTGNDFDDNLRSTFARLDDNGDVSLVKGTYSWGTAAFYRVQRWLYENSHLVFFLKNAAENAFRMKLTPSSKETAGASEEDAGRITGELIRMMSAEVGRDQVRFGVVIIPSRRELEAGSVSGSDFVASTCRTHDIPFLRLDAVLKAEDYFEYDEHLNGRGHRVVSRELVRFLMSPAFRNQQEGVSVGSS